MAPLWCCLKPAGGFDMAGQSACQPLSLSIGPCVCFTLNTMISDNDDQSSRAVSHS